MYILLFRNSILHAFFALMFPFDDWMIQNWTSKSLRAISQYAAIKMMELLLNLTRLECLNPLDHAPLIYYYHDQVPFGCPDYFALTTICIIFESYFSRTQSRNIDIRYLFDRHASSLSRRSEKYWKIFCWIWLGWVLSSRNFVYDTA